MKLHNAQSPGWWHYLLFLLVMLALQEWGYFFLSQGGYGYEVSAIKEVLGTIIRLIVELQVAIILLITPRPLSRVLIASILVLFIAAIMLAREAGFLLTLSLALSNYREAIEVSTHGLGLNITDAMVLLSVGLLSVLAWVVLPQKRLRYRTVMVVLIPFLIFDSILVMAIDPPQRIRTYISKERIMLSYGYIGMLVADGAFIVAANRQEAYEGFLENGQNAESQPIEGVLKFDPVSIYMIQWESLDYIALEQLEDGSFLKGLEAAVGVQNLKTEHINGSADTDYAILTGLPTPRDINPYLLSATRREAYLAKDLNSQGFATNFVHCNTERFFSRGKRVSEFGFSRIYWSESFGFERDGAGFWGLDDRKCVERITNDVGLTSGQFLYFITLTSHYPYRNIPASRNSDGNLLERYMIEVKNTDMAISTLVSAMPNRSLLLVYGDHGALGMPGFSKQSSVPLLCALIEESVFVPCGLSFLQGIWTYQLGQEIWRALKK